MLILELVENGENLGIHESHGIEIPDKAVLELIIINSTPAFKRYIFGQQSFSALALGRLEIFISHTRHNYLIKY